MNSEINYEYDDVFISRHIDDKIKKILSYIAYIILISMGWYSIPEKEIIRAKKYKKMVYIFPHTSYWDFWLILIYSLAFPKLTENIYIVMKPQPFDKWYGKLLKKLKFIPSTPLEQKGGNFVDSICNYMKKKEEISVMLSPEGTLNKSEWKSGYYHIAKNLDIPIMVVGIDYELKTMIAKEYRYVSEYTDKQSIENILKYDMSTIIPLYIERSYVSISKKYNSIYVNSFDFVMLSNFLMSIYLLYFLLKTSWLLMIHGMIFTIISLYYHYYKETYYIFMILDSILSLSYIIHEIIYLYNSNKMVCDIFWIIMIIMSIFTYIWGGKRRCDNFRNEKYIHYHGIFHICIGLTLTYPLL